jgi:hypothetical protein
LPGRSAGGYRIGRILLSNWQSTLHFHLSHRISLRYDKKFSSNVNTLRSIVPLLASNVMSSFEAVSIFLGKIAI